MNILDIGQIRDYSIALFMYKMSNGNVPSLFEIMFVQASDVQLPNGTGWFVICPIFCY